MKKLLALMLAAALALSLVACGGGSGAGDNNSTNTPSGGGEDSMTKEEMLEVATELDANELDSAMYDNMARANNTYVGNTYKISHVVERVESNYCVLRDDALFSIKAYMPEDDLVLLNSGELVTIVGTISNLELVEDESFGYYERYVEMESAYLVTDIAEPQVDK